jgi:hypothetical protein
MTPNAITLLFKEAWDTFPPIKGKPTDNDLQLIRKNLLPILMEIPYDQLGGTHSLVGILTDATRYAANHAGATFIRPLRLPLYNATIADDATTVILFVRNQPTKQNSTTTLVSKLPSAVQPNAYARLLMRCGTTTSRTPTPSTQR